MEEWKDVVGYEGFYQVSNLGRVRGVERYVIHSKNFLRIQKSKIIKPINDNGYYSVLLHKESNIKRIYIHRLVALSFINKIDGKYVVNHIDENRKNNNVNNLMWVTQKENNNWGTKIIRKVLNTDYKSIADKNSKPIIQYNKDMNIVRTWKSSKEIHRELGYSCGNISMACNGKYNKPLYNSYWAFM